MKKSLFKINILSTDKSDAIILKTENHCALIDTGNEEDGEAILSKLKEYGANKIDYLFITHFDKDHVGGVPKLFKSNFEINIIITPNCKKKIKKANHSKNSKNSNKPAKNIVKNQEGSLKRLLLHLTM